MIRIQLNGDPHELEGPMTLSELIASLKQRPELLVAELNEKIIKRDRYTETMVGEGDVIELLKFVGGGAS